MLQSNMDKKYNPLYLALAILFLVIAISKFKNASSSKNEKPDIANQVYEYPGYNQGNFKVAITQAMINAYSTTSKDPSNKDLEHVHYIISSMINTSTDLQDNLTLKGAKITNIKVKYSGPGTIKIIAPSHVKTSESVSYYLTTDRNIDPFKLPKGSKTIEYKLANTDAPEYLDEIGKYNTGTMEFAIAIIGVGKYNRRELLDKYGRISSTKVFEYAGINPKKLDADIEFDVVFTLSNNKTEKHHVKAHIDGEELYKSGHFSALDNVRVE